MNRMLSLSVLVLAVALTPAVAQTGNVSVGPIFSLNFQGFNSPLGGMGVTGKAPGLAPVWGLNFKLSPSESTYFLGVTADWILYKQPLYSPFNLNFYMGPGVYGSINISQESRADFGLRIPFGANWTPVRFLEVFSELSPAFGITIQDPIKPDWIFQAAVGGRVWF